MIFLRRFLRRIQFIVGGFHGLGEISVQLVKYGHTSLSQMGFLVDDRIHCFTHQRQDEVILISSPCCLLAYGELSGTTGKDIAVQLCGLITQLLLIVIEVIDDGFELSSNLGSLLPQGFTPGVVYILLLFSRCQVSVKFDQLTDAFFCSRPSNQIVTGGRTILASADGNAIGIMLLPVASTGDAVGTAAPAIFVFQEVDVLLRSLLPEELIVDAVFAVHNITAPAYHIVDSCLR